MSEPLAGIQLYAFNIITISGIILFFFVFLGYLIGAKILYPICFPPRDKPVDPAFQNVHWPALLGCLSILYGPFVVGMLWAWHQTCFFEITPDGGWTFRNPFYITRGHVPAGTPRTLEYLLYREKEYRQQSTREVVNFQGELWVTVPGQPPIYMWAPNLPTTADDRLRFPENLGYRIPESTATGPHDGIQLPLHTFSASGPEKLRHPGENGPPPHPCGMGPMFPETPPPSP